MITLNITAVVNSNNTTTFAVLDENGLPFNLDIEGATEVFVRVCDRLQTAEIRNVSFSANTLTVALGKLSLPPGVYKPKIMYISPSKPEGIALAAECFETQIILKMVC